MGEERRARGLSSHRGPIQVGVLGLTSQSAAGRATGDPGLAEKGNTGSG